MFPFKRKLFFNPVAGLALALGIFGAIGAHAGWELAWNDEFDRPGLPDPAKWDYETGYVRNNEAQYYTRARKENARVENGMLVIEARKENFPISGAGTNNEAHYTSASLNTHGKASWTYGRMEIRAKIPHGKGAWPAFWTLGEKGSWPKGGEIDVMEFVGKKPDRIYGTVHYANPSGKHESNGGSIKTKKPYDGFHIYAVEWFPDRIDFYFDNQKYHTFPLEAANAGAENPFRKPQYILLNFALGGSWGGPIDDSVLPQKYLIDYVRVYKWKPD